MSVVGFPAQSEVGLALRVGVGGAVQAIVRQVITVPGVDVTAEMPPPVLVGVPIGVAVKEFMLGL